MSIPIINNTNIENTPLLNNLPTQKTGYEEKKELLSWIAPARPFKRRDKEFFTTIVVIASLIGVILLFMGDLLAILVILSFMFLTFVLVTVPPEDVKNIIFNTGIQTAEHFYDWKDLRFYTFDEKWGQEILVLYTQARFPGALYLLLNDQKREYLEQIIGTALIKRDDITPGFLENAASWVMSKIPLESK